MDNKQSEQGTPRARRSSCIAGGRRISLGMRKNEPISANNSVKTDKYFRDSDGTEEDPTQIILCGATDSEGEEDGYTTCLQPQEETVFGTAIFEEDEELLIVIMFVYHAFAFNLMMLAVKYLITYGGFYRGKTVTALLGNLTASRTTLPPIWTTSRNTWMRMRLFP